MLPAAKIISNPKSVVAAYCGNDRKPEPRRPLLLRPLIEAFEQMRPIQRCRAGVAYLQKPGSNFHDNPASGLRMQEGVLDQISDHTRCQ